MQVLPGRLERLWYRVHPGAAARLALPQFLGIGAQKAGTTWLAENLRRHPEVFIPERKELHWLDHKWERPLSDWARHFAGAGDRVRGEITPAYGILPPERIRFLRRVDPDVRLLLILRDPVERAWSHAVMDLAERRGRPPEAVPETEYLAFFDSEVAVRRGDYLAILDRWLAVFPPDQLWVGFFDAIREEPRRLLKEVFRHIGVSVDVDWETFPFAQRISPAVSQDRKGHALRVESGGGERAACPPAVRDWLARRYAADLEKLAERFGAPAARWRAERA
jgi:hypothetical protein